MHDRYNRNLFVDVSLSIKASGCRFFLQTDAMVKGKGIYGNLQGIWHSLQHSLLTFFIVYFIVPTPFAFALAVFDFVTHYHIDWVKMKFGCRDITQSKFWHQLGLDQFAHQLVYIAIVFLVFSV